MAQQIVVNRVATIAQPLTAPIDQAVGLVVCNAGGSIQPNLSADTVYSVGSIEDVEALGIVPIPASLEAQNKYGIILSLTSATPGIIAGDTASIQFNYEGNILPNKSINVGSIPSASILNTIGIPADESIVLSYWDDVTQVQYVVTLKGIYTLDATASLYTKVFTATFVAPYKIYDSGTEILVVDALSTTTPIQIGNIALWYFGFYSINKSTQSVTNLGQQSCTSNSRLLPS